MRVLRGTAFGLALLIAIVFVAAALQPTQFRIERSIQIKTSSEAAFNQVNDFHNWANWSPYAKLDPSMKITFEGAPMGIGAIYFWSGNGQVGEGRMTIMTSLPGKRVDMKLEFIRPFNSINVAEFVFRPVETSTPSAPETIVTWAMSGPHSLLERVFCLFFNMDKIVGGDFERGLTTLKQHLESAH